MRTFLFFPNRSDRRREGPVVKTSNGQAKLVWTQIKVPTDCRAAGRTEVAVHFASVSGLSAIDFVLPFEPHLGLQEEALHANGTPVRL